MDHRIAMSALVLGLASQRPVTIDDGAFIATSFPGFADMIRRLGGDVAG
jgi:3-phosphoshikimate 1-carboxyvinyltransferase